MILEINTKLFKDGNLSVALIFIKFLSWDLHNFAVVFIVLCKILITFFCEIFQISGPCICWLSCQSSMQCKIRNKFVKIRKFLNVENFSATTIGQAPVQTKNMIEKYYTFFDFFRKNNVDDRSFGTTFLRKVPNGAEWLVDYWDE